MKPTSDMKPWYRHSRQALAEVPFTHGARRAFGQPVAERVPGATTYIAREDEHTGVVAFVRYEWDPHAPTWAKPLATGRLAAEPCGVAWRPCVVWPFEVVA